MDYNKSFLSYETISSARCQTQAAAEAVQKIGLIQIKDVDPSWFADGKISEMFFQRLDFLRSVEKTTYKFSLPCAINAEEAHLFQKYFQTFW